MIPPMQVNKSVSSLDNFRSMSVPQATRRRRAVHCVVATVALLAIGALTVGCAIVVREYALSRAYDAASCRLVNVSYLSDDAECTYCAGSVDKSRSTSTASSSSGSTSGSDGNKGSHASCFPVAYPCVRITVDFSPAGVSGGGGVGVSGDGFKRRAVLYADTMQASGFNTMCSVSVCHRTRDENVRLVEEYTSRFTAGRTFSCFYDSETFDNVIAHKVYTRSDAVHCLLWPSAVIIVCACILLYIELVNRALISPPCDGLKLHQANNNVMIRTPTQNTCSPSSV